MTFQLLTFPAKKLRARVIADYMRQAGIPAAVCFSCGNASQALKEQMIEVLDISPNGDLRTTGSWWSPERVARTFPGRFDATSGHLSMPLMLRIADQFRRYLHSHAQIPYAVNGPVDVATGSGETLVCLKIAFPNTRFRAIYNLNSATKYQPNAPLNELVRQMADEVIITEPPIHVVGHWVGANLHSVSNADLKTLPTESNR